MGDYWCHECGGGTSMMGHAKRSDLIGIIGKWQIGGISLPDKQSKEA